MSAESKKLNYGTRDILDDRHRDLKNEKYKITMWVDGDILDELKNRAEQVGAGYQTYIHKILKDHIQKKSFEQRLQSLEKNIKSKKVG